MVLSCKKYPYDKLYEAQTATWDSEQHNNVETVYYFADEYELMHIPFKQCIDEVWNKDWDIIFRTNSSSYINKQMLYDYIKDFPINNTWIGDPWSYNSGCGFFMSRNLVQILRDNLTEEPFPFDDVLIADIITRHTKLTPISGKRNVYDHVNKSFEPCYHHRCKCDITTITDKNGTTDNRQQDIDAMYHLHKFYKMITGYKVHIITANFGTSDLTQIKLPHNHTSKHEITFSCYNDENTDSRLNSLHPRLKGKIPKMLGWMNKQADFYIWLDASFEITSPTFVDDLIEQLGDKDICLFNHSVRSSISSEFAFVMDNITLNPYLSSRYGGESMQSQINSYLSDITFEDSKLFEMGFFIYSKKLIQNKDYNVMTDWFFHNCYYSVQDQLSFPYLLHKHNVNYTTFPIDQTVYRNPYTKFSKK